MTEFSIQVSMATSVPSLTSSSGAKIRSALRLRVRWPFLAAFGLPVAPQLCHFQVKATLEPPPSSILSLKAGLVHDDNRDRDSKSGIVPLPLGHPLKTQWNDS
jgi:hypothetical protein